MIRRRDPGVMHKGLHEMYDTTVCRFLFVSYLYLCDS